MPKKFSSNIADLPFDKLYLLALARALLTESQILVLYEFPTNLSDKERENIKKLLKSMHGTRTILIFSAKEYCSDIADKIVNVESGAISDITYNNQAEIM